MNNNYDRADHRAGRSMTMTEKAEELTELDRLRLASEDAAGGPPGVEQVEALIDLVDALEARLAALTTPQEEDEDDCRCLVDLIREHDLAADENTSPREYRVRLALGILASGFSRAAAPEPEWEYGIRGGSGLMLPELFSNVLDAQRFAGPDAFGRAVLCRRKAGPWLPVGSER